MYAVAVGRKAHAYVRFSTYFFPCARPPSSHHKASSVFRTRIFPLEQRMFFPLAYPLGSLSPVWCHSSLELSGTRTATTVLGIIYCRYQHRSSGIRGHHQHESTQPHFTSVDSDSLVAVVSASESAGPSVNRPTSRQGVAASLSTSIRKVAYLVQRSPAQGWH